MEDRGFISSKVCWHNPTCMRCVVRHNTKIRIAPIFYCATQHILCRTTKFSLRSVRLCKSPIKLPTYTLAGFELTTHNSSLLEDRRRQYH
jgi:hypothetical protein